MGATGQEDLLLSLRLADTSVEKGSFEMCAGLIHVLTAGAV